MPNSTTGATSTPELLVVGRIVAAQGLRGELRVHPLSDFPERFTKPGRRWLQRPARGKAAGVKAGSQPPSPQSGGQPLETHLLSGRPLPGKELYVIRLEGVDDRSAAEALVGHELMVPAAERPKLAAGEFHLLDLIGLEVRLLTSDQPSSGSAIGRVLDLVHAGNDLLEVELSAGDGPGQPPRRLLIPFVNAIVPRVELAEGWIGITPPPGLLDLAVAADQS